MKFLRLTQGEVLLILVNRDGRKAQQIAEAFGYASYTYLSRLYSLYNRTKKMPEDLVRKASEVLGVPPEFFDVERLDHLLEKIESLESRVSILELEKKEQSASLALAHARLDDCERTKQILSAKRN